MKSFFKKLAFVMALAMVVSLAAPAAQSAFAAAEFTYAEQESGKKVTSLSMKAGNEVDLKFIGVKDYKNYTLKWESSNEAVATVDKNGVITAVADGVARVELKVGDGVDYTSAPVVVTVGEVMNVTLGTPENKSITEHTLKIGEEIDLNFYGVKDWSTSKYNCRWVSTDLTVVEVDNKGVVKALAAGTARVTALITEKSTGTFLNVIPVEFTVAAGADVTPTPVPVSTAFKAKQVSTDTVELIFESEPENVTVDTLEINWLISDLEVGLSAKNIIINGNVATVVLNDKFTNGSSYVFRCNNAEATLVASAGEIVKVGLTYYTDDETAGAGKAYVSTDDETATTILVPHFYDANGVDVTALYDVNDFNISYDLAISNNAFDLIDNELTFNAAGQAVVNMTVEWADDAGEPKKLASLGNSIIGVKRPAMSFSSIRGGFLVGAWYTMDDDDNIDPVADFSTNPESYFWKNNLYMNTWVAGDEEDLQFSALVKDSRGNTVATGIEQGDGEGQYPYGHFTYASSKESVLDIDDSGILSIYEAGTANVLIYFVPANASDEDAERILIGGVKITVKPERYVASYKMTTDTQSKLIATVKNTITDENGKKVDVYTANEFDNNNATFVLQAFDQYGSGIALDDEGDIEIKAVSSTNDVELTAEFNSGDSSHGWTPHYHINVDADDYAAQVKSSSTKSIQYRATVDKSGYPKMSGSSVSFTLKLTNVSKYKEDFDAFFNGTSEKTPTFYYNIAAKTTSVDLAVKNIVNFGNTWAQAHVKSKDISVNYLHTSNGMTMAKVPADYIHELEDGQKTGEAGHVYYKVTTTSNSLKDKMDVAVSDGKITVSWPDQTGTASGSSFVYAPTGTYRITLYTAKTDGAKLSSKTYTYNVANSQSEVQFAGYNKELGNETENSISANISDEEAIAIIKENLVFTLDGKVLDLDNDYVVKGIEAKIRSQKEGSFYVDSVNITIRLDDGNNRDTYESKNIKVGRTIKEKK